MPTITHHGRTTAYRVSGGQDGRTPVLFVHASGQNSEMWAGQRDLSGGRPTVTLDLSGHGDSDDISATPGGETLAAYESDVVAVAEETGADVLVGASLGGATALRIALDKALDLEALVLTATGAKLSVLSDLLAWLKSDFPQAVDFLHRPDVFYHNVDEELLERSRARLRDTGQAVTHRDFQSCHLLDVRDRVNEIEVPTLALVGEYDRLTPRWYHEYLAENIPDCELAVIEDAAHLAMVEQADRFNDAMLEFLSTNGL